MLHYLIELAVWMLATFFVGCCIGCLLRKLFGAEAAVEIPKAAIAVPAAAASIAAVAPTMRAAAPAPIAPPAPVAIPTPVVVATPLAAAGTVVRMERPRGITAARGGKADDLLRISGVGPKNEKILHSLGFYHFDQIADWTPGQVAWVDDHLKFNGRIDREEWINQARLLRDGKEAEFNRLYGSGGMHRSSGSDEPLVNSQAKVVSTAATLKSAVDEERPASSGKLERPKGIAKARGGKADELQRISGVGPKNESILHGLGFFHFDQIAAWTSTEVNWVDDHLRFGGRIKREEWIRQARLLSEGKEAEFTKLYGTGGMRNQKGGQASGARTRKS